MNVGTERETLIWTSVTLSRPSGTKSVNGGFSHTLFSPARARPARNWSGKLLQNSFRFVIDALNKSTSIGIRPIRMLRFEFGTDLFARLISRHALLLKRQSPRANPRDQLSFRITIEPSPGAL